MPKIGKTEIHFYSLGVSGKVVPKLSIQIPSIFLEIGGVFGELWTTEVGTTILSIFLNSANLSEIGNKALLRSLIT
jgi:hypothetical protein